MSEVVKLFESKKMVKICAPMVRYSKLPFRSLVRKYNCDLCFTPMILANSFIQSNSARNNEFTTSSGDHPVIVQFAANNAHDFSSAAEMVAPFSDGVDLNCGCPQRWAMNDGYGANLLTKPELIRDIVLQVRNRIPHPFTVSTKIRILEDLKKSIDLCQQLEAAGVSFISVHARTPAQRHQPINIDALQTLRSCVKLPLVANGDVKSLEEAEKLHALTKCEGIMVARGILTNPALFAGFPVTPVDCIAQWVALGLQFEPNFQVFHHHLNFMLEKIIRKGDRIVFNNLKTTSQVITFLEEYFNIDFSQTTCSFAVIEECNYNGSYPKLKKSNNSALYEDYLENSCLF